MVIAAIIGLAFGFLGSVPVAGPISALVFSRGLQGRFRSGVFIAFGGGIAEAAYAFLAFWGFSTFLTRYEFIVPVSRALAAVILTVLGISFMRGGGVERDKPEKLAPERRAATSVGSFMLGFSITALNPTLLVTWPAAVASVYGAQLFSFGSQKALPFALGACVGIAGWFCILLALIRRYRDRFSFKTLERAVRVFGLFLVALAVWFVVRFVQYLLGAG